MNNVLPKSLPPLLRDAVIIKLPNATPEQIERIVQHLIRLWLYFYHLECFVKKGHWVNVKARDLDRKFRTMVYPIRYRYRFFLDILIQINWLEENPLFVPDIFSKSFRIPLKQDYTPAFYDMPSTYKPKNQYLKEYELDKDLIENHYRASIDIGEAKEKMSQIRDEGFYKNKPVYDKQIFSWYKYIHDFNSHNFWFARNHDRRLYSTYTNMPSFLRKAVKIDGLDCGTIDMSCVAPTIVAHHLQDKNFLNLCQTGMLYDYIVSRTTYTRNEVKEKLMRHIFFAENINTNYKFVKAFDNIFPGLISQIETFMQTNNPFWKWFHELEAKIIITGFRNCGFPYLTCHDSITTPRQHLVEGYNIMERVIKNLGYKIKLKID